MYFSNDISLRFPLRFLLGCVVSLVAAVTPMSASLAATDPPKVGQAAPAEGPSSTEKFKLIIMIKKKKGMTRAEFVDYLENHHSVLIRKHVPPVLELYRRNYIIFDDPFVTQSKDGRTVGAEVEHDFDCIIEVIYTSREGAQQAMKALYSGDTKRVITEDESKFIEPGSVKSYVVEVHQSKLP